MISFQENTQTKGWADAISYRTIPATARGSAAVDWHFKIKDIEHDVVLTKNICITASMQKINSIHKLILKIQLILRYHILNGQAHF